MKRKIILLVMLAFSTFVFSASAQTTRGLRGEHKRIRHGVKSGQLTRPETKRLRKEENHLKKEAARFKTNDGQLTPAEKRKLRHDKRKLDRDIRRQSHDAQQH